MSERLEESRASLFIARHVNAPRDYEAYKNEVVTQWRAAARGNEHGQQELSGFWLRRNGNSYNQFQAHIDYYLPDDDGFKSRAAIDISADSIVPEIQVWAVRDESDEPHVLSNEAYNMPALERAITLVETLAIELH
jgi:hypothetical protein